MSTNGQRPFAICLSFDEAYAPFAGVALTSLLQHWPSDRPLCAYLIYECLSDDERARFDELRQTFPNLSIHHPSTSAFGENELPISTSGWPRAIFFRLFADRLLPDEPRALLIDSDVLVCGDLSNLSDLPLNGSVIAAVEDLAAHLFITKDGTPQNQKLSALMNGQYFNSGVMLIDLEQSRRTGFLEKVRALCLANPSLKMPDQDALNLVCEGDWVRLPKQLNAMTSSWSLRDRLSPESQSLLHHAFRNPLILHYSGKKPWNANGFSVFSQRYRQAVAQTPWRSAMRLEPYSIGAILKSKLNQAVALRIRRREFNFRIAGLTLVKWAPKVGR